jgi:CHAT domain-containing protein/tetratricopeptide (TPR) repeat protein
MRSASLVCLLGLLYLAGPGTQAGDHDPASLIAQGRYAEAETLARQQLAAAEAAHGPESTEAADALDLLVEALWRGGKEKSPGANDLAQRAVATREKIGGADSVALARSLDNLGTLLRRAGDFARAKAAFERSLAIREKALGMEHPDVANSLNGLANVLIEMGDYATAGPLLDRTLAIREAALGANHPDVAKTLLSMAALQREEGDYQAARRSGERALAIRETALGPDHPDVADVLISLGMDLDHLGEPLESRRLFERALAIKEKSFGPNHPDVGLALVNYSNLLQSLGDLAAAQAMAERALANFEASLGPEHPKVGAVLYNLGLIRKERGDLAGAKAAYERALTVLQKSLGEEHPSCIIVEEALANLLRKMGLLSDAKPVYARILAWRERTLGPRHPDVAIALYNLAYVLRQSGDPAGALPLVRRALAIDAEVFGPDHPKVASDMAELAEIDWLLGRYDSAVETAVKSEEIGRESFIRTARGLSEREALTYAGSVITGLDAGWAALAAAGPRGAPPDAARRLWDQVIRSRALVLDELAARHRSVGREESPETAALAQALDASRRDLAHLVVGGPDPKHPEEYQSQMLAALKDKESRERALAEKSLAFRAERDRTRAGLTEVGRALREGLALVAYHRYERLLKPPERSKTGYLALVLKGGSRDPVVIPLGDAAAIDALVEGWRDEVRRDPRVASPGDDALAGYRAAGERLRKAIWDPVAARLGRASLVFVVPDGPLGLVSLAALPTGADRYLVETGPAIHYLSAERDLVRGPAGLRHGNGLLVLGGPDFDADPAGPAVAHRSERTEAGASESSHRSPRASCGDFRSLVFDPLPRAVAEAGEIERLWSQRGSPVVKLTGALADEATFKRIAPDHAVLHLATHAFFVGAECDAAGAGGRTDPVGSPEALADSPLVMSGLALAGANHREKIGPDSDAEDGILTAEEIASLDLSGVELTVLSACGTGLGTVMAGEGILGLRRAFEVAGAGSLVTSLWSVQDEATRQWMSGLYRGRVAGLSIVEAARAASLGMLEEARRENRSTHPYYWGGFVAAGDWR